MNWEQSDRGYIGKENESDWLKKAANQEIEKKRKENESTSD